MTSVTLCDLLFFLHFRLVSAIVLIWNWRRAIPWVIMLFHSNDPNHLSRVTHSVKWCQQCKHKPTPTGSPLVPPHAYNIEKYIGPILPFNMPLIWGWGERTEKILKNTGWSFSKFSENYKTRKPKKCKAKERWSESHHRIKLLKNQW